MNFDPSIEMFVQDCRQSIIFNEGIGSLHEKIGVFTPRIPRFPALGSPLRSLFPSIRGSREKNFCFSPKGQNKTSEIPLLPCPEAVHLRYDRLLF